MGHRKKGEKTKGGNENVKPDMTHEDRTENFLSLSLLSAEAGLTELNISLPKCRIFHSVE